MTLRAIAARMGVVTVAVFLCLPPGSRAASTMAQPQLDAPPQPVKRHGYVVHGYVVREEFYNVNVKDRPSGVDYKRLLCEFAQNVRQRLHDDKGSRVSSPYGRPPKCTKAAPCEEVHFHEYPDPSQDRVLEIEVFLIWSPIIDKRSDMPTYLDGTDKSPWRAAVGDEKRTRQDLLERAAEALANHDSPED
jgi:hypothetical protein